MIRLYYLANDFLSKQKKADQQKAQEIITSYLRHVNTFKDEDISISYDRLWATKYLPKYDK